MGLHSHTCCCQSNGKNCQGQVCFSATSHYCNGVTSITAGSVRVTNALAGYDVTQLFGLGTTCFAITIPSNLVGDYSYTVTPADPKILGTSGTFYFRCRQNQNINLDLYIAPGYICSCAAVMGDCNGPIPSTLHLSDSLLGITASLTAVATDPLHIYWTGTTTYSYPGCGSCPKATVTLTYYFGDLTSIPPGNPCFGGGLCCGLYTLYTCVPSIDGFCPATLGAHFQTTCTGLGDGGIGNCDGTLSLGATITCSPYSWVRSDALGGCNLWVDGTCSAAGTTITVSE